MLEALWQRGLPRLLERIVVLETAAQALCDGTAGATTREEACTIAHKLAGSLGMFGYPQGTEIARRIEALLQQDQPYAPDVLLQQVRDLRNALPL